MLVLLFTWLTCALTYYGVVLLITEVHATANGCSGNRANLHSSDFRDIFITTVAELPGATLVQN